MSRFLDEISPDYIAAEALRMTLATTDKPRAFNDIDINVGIHPNSKIALGAGLVLPLELTVAGPSPANFYRHIFTNVVPSIVTFKPREGGLHTVTLSEVGHCRWWGRLRINVAGESTARQ